ncbi:MAG: hypothetical protein KDD33_04635 [Bdellovibrionales bacterium]|nr:hypothetical protein [Bdellovibrionales bacterium]
MKSTFLIISILFALPMAQAKEFKLTDASCLAKADEYVKVIEDKLAKDIGVIQGYFEDRSVTFTSKKSGDDELETFHYEITGENDEGDWWVSEYNVEILSAGSLGCYLQSVNYLGVTSYGNHYEDEE